MSDIFLNFLIPVLIGSVIGYMILKSKITYKWPLTIILGLLVVTLYFFLGTYLWIKEDTSGAGENLMFGLAQSTRLAIFWFILVAILRRRNLFQ